MIYTIKKGRHDSGFHFMPLFNIQEMSALVKFHPSCLYRPTVAFQGVNKLFGFSEGIDHMKNSVRMGWTSNGETIFIHHFVHKDGRFYSQHAFEAPLNKWVLMTVRSSKKNLFGYRLYPYFGGTETAPHDMRIEIKWQ